MEAMRSVLSNSDSLAAKQLAAAERDLKALSNNPNNEIAASSLSTTMKAIAASALLVTVAGVGAAAAATPERASMQQTSGIEVNRPGDGFVGATYPVSASDQVVPSSSTAYSYTDGTAAPKWLDKNNQSLSPWQRWLLGGAQVMIGIPSQQAAVEQTVKSAPATPVRFTTIAPTAAETEQNVPIGSVLSRIVNATFFTSKAAWKHVEDLHRELASGGIKSTIGANAQNRVGPGTIAWQTIMPGTDLRPLDTRIDLAAMGPGAPDPNRQLAAANVDPNHTSAFSVGQEDKQPPTATV
jgi:hypothetical protein